jgi:gamma-glutamyltranspeptidase / glutathione hydrolase
MTGAVSCGHRLESEAGLAVLAAGGNAVDAVVAAAFAGFVVEPASCGLGGYGHLAVYLAGSRRFVSVDHYVRAPASARPDMFAPNASDEPTYYGWPAVSDRRNETGALAVAVPGAVAGLCLAQERFGRLALAELLAPAIDLADAGTPVRWDLALAISGRLSEIRKQPGAAALLLRDGLPPTLGEDGGAASGARLDTSALAATLREIACSGAHGFYDGWVAEAIVRAVAEGGGILDSTDLARYEPHVDVEQGASYRGWRYATAGDPVGYETLNILDSFALGDFGADSWEYRHLMAEALGHAFADNMQHYSDPLAGPSPAAALASRDFAAMRAAAIDLGQAAPRPIVAADPWPFADQVANAASQPSTAGVGGTSHMVAADGSGNLASLITSVTAPLGSLVLVAEAGFFLNNGMRNFDPRPGRANSIAPGKRPIFAVPALVAERDGQGAFAAAGAGGYRIASAVTQAFVNHVDFGLTVEEAVDHPRLHCQGEATFVDARIAPEITEKLRRLGHVVVELERAPAPLNFARVGAIARAPDGELRAAGDPPWQTSSEGRR